MCEKCNDTGVVPGEDVIESVNGGSDIVYSTMKFCECRMQQKKQEVEDKIKFTGKKSWVDKYKEEAE